ncbi:hypothetical protein C0Z18_31905 [Trinickia dabaoshanensis]|uniref:Uncharacterized protein n=1 Tax=Trinickia dabaoshanensis TaxID=564714 RepID=A0A2N7VB34_9BURK|nr:hypothetical protein [Trinickia dabaoshanensis]PMS14368.1 hypothetical protein C0Z18_31905 [Trinickia dabaoshanensis]
MTRRITPFVKATRELTVAELFDFEDAYILWKSAPEATEAVRGVLVANLFLKARGEYLLDLAEHVRSEGNEAAAHVEGQLALLRIAKGRPRKR